MTPVELSSPAIQELAISTHQLRKVFDGKAAVRGLTLDVRRGEVFGFLGPNGAGKSTSVKMLLGLVKPTSGEATVLGRPLTDRVTRAKIGFLPEHFRFYDWLTPAELLHVHGRLYGMAPETLRQRIPQLLATVGLTPHRDKQLRRFSKGMLQRIGLAQALINNPELLFLDEPTSGLDPVGRRLVRDLIGAQRKRGTTVFLNSHLLGEVEATCDRVAFIRSGEVIETREVSSFSDGRVQVHVRARALVEEVVDGLWRWASHIECEGERITLTLDSCEPAPQVLRYLVEAGAQVYEFTPQHLSLEARFLEILGKDEGL
ncbi:MAG TPA: ABC transporter ATP-binding protein [Bryobacteraceae bacterium]|nr:ABC transporter ATP-binding protein [Bryobacteraceae bacterium]